jgi:glycine cleavage system transcriptional repressor
MRQTLAVTAVGKDRPGLVAEVAEALTRAGCNIQDSAMTRLAGEFAMIVIVTAAEEVGAAEIEAGLRGADVAGALTLSVRALDASEAARPPRVGRTYLLSVYGADRAGILARVARLLASRGVNITDVSTRVLGGGDEPLAAMVLEVELPTALGSDALQAELSAAAKEMGVDATLHPAEPGEI